MQKARARRLALEQREDFRLKSVSPGASYTPAAPLFSMSLFNFKCLTNMKKGLFIFAALTSASLYAQQYVHQVLIANEGFFDFQTNAIIEPATIGTYNPSTQTYVVVDTLDGQRFSSDVIIDGNFYYVAADTKIFKYDLNTHQEVASVTLTGVRNLAIAGDKLIATRGEYLQTFDSYSPQHLRLA